MRFKLRNEVEYFYNALIRYGSFFGSSVCFGFILLLLLALNQIDFLVLFFKAAIVTIAIEFIIKSFLTEKRPDFKTVKTKSFFEWFQERGSFPSGHSGNMMVLTTLVYFKYQLPQLTILLILTTLLTGLSRVKLHRHYVKDVIAGYLLGFVVAYLFSL